MGKSIEQRAEERARRKEEKARKKAGSVISAAEGMDTPEQELLAAFDQDRDPESNRKRGFRSIVSTQQAMPILDIRDDIVVLKDGTYVKLMEFSPINFELRSP
ncbi:MAG: hypothetical protein IJK38_06025, partial [Oscillospiraceae bacterium]|nr:hypothetical protein [Oscillospiraceae bacterium]